jgi:hypothetical protein
VHKSSDTGERRQRGLMADEERDREDQEETRTFGLGEHWTPSGPAMAWSPS